MYEVSSDVSVFLTAASGQGPVRVTKVPAPNKALIFEAKVPASLDAVWVAFTTNDGLSAWLAPDAAVGTARGLGNGGSTGGGTILSFTPKSRIVMSATARRTPSQMFVTNARPLHGSSLPWMPVQPA